METQLAPLLAPWWVPTVVVLNRQMPEVGLSWGLWTLEETEKGGCTNERIWKNTANTMIYLGSGLPY
jgi:hypothetical protein